MASAVFAALCSSCTRREPLPVLGDTGDFRLTAESGLPFESTALRGKIWVADFIFTNCQGPCPRMTSLMKRLEEQAPAVQLVSFTVDPARDSPEVLAAYAKQYRADPSRWRFLTGDLPELHRLSREVFKLGNVDGRMDHSTRFVLVDRRGRIRGYYGTQEDAPLQRLLDDIHYLMREAS